MLYIVNRKINEEYFCQTLQACELGEYHEKYTREWHARGDATTGGGAPRGFAARSRVFLHSPKNGELARGIKLYKIFRFH